MTKSSLRSRNTRELNTNPEHSTEALVPFTERAGFCQLAFWMSSACYFLARPSSKLHSVRAVDRLVCSSPLCFFECFRKFCRFQSIHTIRSKFYICIYLLYVTWTTCFGLSYFRPSSGPSIALLFAVPGVMWLFS